MSTFTQDDSNARAAGSSADKDAPTAEGIAAAEGSQTEGQATIPGSNPQQPVETLDESDSEKKDRHLASTELPVSEVTDPSTQADSAPAEDAKELLVAGAASGPDVAGVVRNDHGKVAHAPAGSLDAAFNGVQQDASGHVDSVGTDNSSKSNTRI